MINLIKRIYNRFFFARRKNKNKVFDFNESNPLGGNGERVDIRMDKRIRFSILDMYQKSHWRRYEYAKKIIKPGDICGDFACGTGYGSVILSQKADSVIGADLNKEVIDAISKRYINYGKVKFFKENLLNLNFDNVFDIIVSFETIEHFNEEDIKTLLRIFNTSLKQNGKLIMSTPYMQEQSENAIKMGFHLTFDIDETKLKIWLEEAGFKIKTIKYQNYATHDVVGSLKKKDFIICTSLKTS